MVTVASEPMPLEPRWVDEDVRAWVAVVTWGAVTTWRSVAVWGYVTRVRWAAAVSRAEYDRVQDLTSPESGGAALAPSPPPSAGGSSVWDRLAQCESGGNWSIATGNGYFGGLQWLPSTWWAYGGQGMPHHASREQQIVVAERLLAASGGRFTAWPGCRARLGLP